MRATPEQRERFKKMVRDFAEKYQIEYSVMDDGDKTWVKLIKPYRYADNDVYYDPDGHEVFCAVCWPEVRSLTEAATAIFVHAIRKLNLDGWEPVAKTPRITNVIYNPPATVVFWSDGTKTVVKCGDGDEFDPEKGLAMAISKKMLGNQGNYYNEFKKWTWKHEVENVYPKLAFSPVYDAGSGRLGDIIRERLLSILRRGVTG